MTSQEIVVRIIDKIRNHPDWCASHSHIVVGDRKLRYYDTEARDYYGIKGFGGPVEISVYPSEGGNIEFNCDSLAEFESFFASFNLLTWLLEIDHSMIAAGMLTKAEQEAANTFATIDPNEIIINNITYIRKDQL